MPSLTTEKTFRETLEQAEYAYRRNLEQAWKTCREALNQMWRAHQGARGPTNSGPTTRGETK